MLVTNQLQYLPQCDKIVFLDKVLPLGPSLTTFLRSVFVRDLGALSNLHHSAYVIPCLASASAPGVLLAPSP